MSIYDISGNIISSAVSYEPADDDIPTVEIAGTLPTTKDQGDVSITIKYTSKSDTFTSYAYAKVQGDSSTAYSKKNYTIKLFSDSNRTNKLKKQFRDWDGKRNKFVLKANFIDHTHSRNIVNARLWTKIVKSRSDYSTLPSALKKGNIAIDGFPVKVYVGGYYVGIYTWNLPKDSLYGLDDSVDGNAIVQGDSGEYSGSILWRASNDSAEKWSDETHDSKPTVITNGFNALLNFVYTSTDSAFTSNFSTYFDKQSIIDQYIFLYVALIEDNIGKNQTFFTYNGTFYYGGMYDLDGTWGLPAFWNTGWTWNAYNVAFQSGYVAVRDGDGTTTNLLYERVGTLFSTDIVSRYRDLRSSVLNEDYIIHEFEKFLYAIPSELFPLEYANPTYIGIPLKYENNISQLKDFIPRRLAYVDSQILS